MNPFLSPSQLLILYIGLIRPCMEYGSHVWGGSTLTILLNRVESKAFRLINSPPLTDCLYFLSHRRNIAYSSLFYQYFHADCSSDLANCMPPSIPRSRCTSISTFSDPYSAHLSNARVNQYLHSFNPYTGKLWNPLPLYVFSTCLWFKPNQKSFKTPLMLTRPPPLTSISPTVHFTSSGDKRIF